MKGAKLVRLLGRPCYQPRLLSRTDIEAPDIADGFLKLPSSGFAERNEQHKCRYPVETNHLSKRSRQHL